MIKNSNQEFGVVAKCIHWAIALLIIGLIWLGWYMVDLSYYDSWYNGSLSLHKALGMIVLGLAVCKMVWLLVSPTPLALPSLKAWEHRVSRIVHWILMLSMFVIPVSGYFISTSKGTGISIFDWFEIPALFPVSESTRDLAIDLHYYAAYTILAIVVMHTGAAMKHQFIDKDGTLKRML
jgi:cytochrome b561